MFKTGDTVFDEEGQPYRLSRLVGQGAQGTVWEEAGGLHIIKIVHARDPQIQAEIHRRFRWLLNREVQRPSRLVLPEALLAPPVVGYVMKRVKGHQPLSRLLNPSGEISFGEWFNNQTGGLRRRLMLGAMLALAFDTIHHEGLAFCDLSDTNVLVAKDPAKVSVALVDPDNLSETGKGESLVLGTPRFMAPELLRGSHQPDALTDSYSLAVVLFQMLRLGHPLLGDAVLVGTPEDESRALQGEAPYVDHPTDVCNRCTATLSAEATCTRGLSALFERSFLGGLTRRLVRPAPSEWLRACMFAADNTGVCPHCQAAFYPRPANGRPGVCDCPWCGESSPEPPRLMIVDKVEPGGGKPRKVGSIVLRPEQTGISSLHITRGVPEPGTVSKIAVVRRRADDTFEIENRSSETFLIQTPQASKPVRLEPRGVQELPPQSYVFFPPPGGGNSSRGDVKILRAATLMVPGGSTNGSR